jgi:hypothetical protein
MGSGAVAAFLSGSRAGKGRTGSEMAASRVARRRRNAKMNQDGEYKMARPYPYLTA